MCHCIYYLWRRGRPPKVHATRIDTAIEHQPTEMRQLKRSAQLAALKESAVSTGSSTNSNTALRSSSSEYQSAIGKHLSLNVECAKLYSDDCFSVLSRARSRKHLELESVYIHVQHPDLCVQKQFVTPLHLFRSHLAPVST